MAELAHDQASEATHCGAASSKVKTPPSGEAVPTTKCCFGAIAKRTKAQHSSKADYCTW